MENLSSNTTLNSSKHDTCEFGLGYIVVVSLIDIIPVLVGQPVITKLMLITFTSEKVTDILNCNLALFHNLQYLISFVHLNVLFLLPRVHGKILKFLFVYVEIGGPMNLSFICMERYVAVINPTSYPLLKKYRFREVCAATVWLLSVPTALMNTLPGEAFSSHRERLLKLLPLQVLIIMTAMMAQCSFSIAKMLRKPGPGRTKLHPAKRRAFKTVCATSAIVLICYTPVTLLQQFGNKDTFDCVIAPICIFFLSAASVVHPLFYLSAQGKLCTCLK